MTYRTNLLICTVLVVLAGGRLAFASSQTNEETALSDAERSVVRVSIVRQTDEGRFLQSYGSGFVVAPGVVVTNRHVVAATLGPDGERLNGMLVWVTPTPGQGDRALNAEVQWTWPTPDLAIIKVPGLEAPVLPLTSSIPGRTDRVRAAGYPGKAEEMLQLTADDIIKPRTPYSTVGAIALLSDRAVGGDAVATVFHGATISRGNSGGPLLDACGRLIGVNTWAGVSQVDSDGAVAVAGDQNVATRVDSLITLLQRTETAFQLDPEPCALGKPEGGVDLATKQKLTELEEALARSEREAAAERLRSANKTAHGELIQRWTWAIVGASVVTGGALVLGRRRRSRSARAEDSHEPAPQPSVLSANAAPPDPQPNAADRVALSDPAEKPKSSRPLWRAAALWTGVIIIGALAALVVSASLAWG
jgi:S1-C subfamily serine protease